MTTIFSNNYLARKPIEKAMIKFAKKFNSEQKILDIGCGKKPYAKYFKGEYIGLDPYKEVNPDIVADAWNIPATDNSFDGVIMNQSLEHIEKINETIAEVKRVLKPNGICIITVPHTMRNHSSPISSKEISLNNFDKNKIKFFNVDYYRFTKFGLIKLLKNFEIIDLQETSGYFGTISQLINYFFASLQPLGRIFLPIYLISNIIGISLDKIFGFTKLINIDIFQKFYEIIYLSLPLNYILIIKNHDKK